MDTHTNGYDRNIGGIRASFPQRKAFVLQFTSDAGPRTGLFRGRIEHVSSGEQASFECPEQLWDFVRRMLERPEEKVHALPSMRSVG